LCCRKSFEALTLLQKIELYLIVIIGYGFILYYADDVYNMITPTKEKTQKINQSSFNPLPSIKDISDTELVDYITEIGKESNLLIKEYSLHKKMIELNLTGDIELLLELLYRLENHLFIISFDIRKEPESYLLNVVIQKHSFDPKESIQKKTLRWETPFSQKTQKKPFQTKEFFISAIINNEVLIDGVWYQKGSLYQGYTITTIETDFVLLENKTTKQIITKRVHNE